MKKIIPLSITLIVVLLGFILFMILIKIPETKSYTGIRNNSIVLLKHDIKNYMKLNRATIRIIDEIGKKEAPAIIEDFDEQTITIYSSQISDFSAIVKVNIIFQDQNIGEVFIEEILN